MADTQSPPSPRGFSEWAKFYQEQMSCHHDTFGIPMFFPESMWGDVQLGDVGLLIDGQFRRLFNILCFANHEWNQNLVPDNFEPHDIDNSFIPVPEVLSKDVLHSSSVKLLTQTTSGSPPQTTKSIQFQVEGDKGAILILHGTAKSKCISPYWELLHYIRRNAQSWRDYLKELQRPFEDDQLIVVTGWTKVSAWHLVAFYRQSESDEPLRGSITATVKEPMSIAFDNPESVVVKSRFGPSPDRVHSPNALMSGDMDSPGRQSVFIRGFRTRKRTVLPGFKLFATAGPHVPPGGPSPPDERHVLSCSSTQDDERVDYRWTPSSMATRKCVQAANGASDVMRKEPNSLTSNSGITIMFNRQGMISRTVSVVALSNGGYIQCRGQRTSEAGEWPRQISTTMTLVVS